MELGRDDAPGAAGAARRAGHPRRRLAAARALQRRRRRMQVERPGRRDGREPGHDARAATAERAADRSDGDAAGRAEAHAPGRWRPGERARVRFDVPVSGDAKLWGPGHPASTARRWTRSRRAGVQQRDSARIGLRTVTVRDGLLELNGKPIELRGASIQEDVDGHGPALTDADVDRDRRPAQGRRRQRDPRALRARRAAAAQARRGRDHGLDPGADLPPRQAAADRGAARRGAVDRPRRPCWRRATTRRRSRTRSPTSCRSSPTRCRGPTPSCATRAR